MNSKDDTNSEIRIYRDLKEFEENLPDTIEVLETPEGDKVYVVGCAHYSLKSQDDVSLAIRNVIPKAVVLELCPLRLHILKLDEKILLEEASKITPAKIKEILKEHGITAGMFYLSFLRTSANITRQLGIAPGGECRRAVSEAKKLKNCKILLGDRPINITLKRAMDGVSTGKRLQLSCTLRSFNESNSDKITLDDVEKFKSRDKKPLKAIEKELPTVYKSFVLERDYILAHSLLLATKIMKKFNPAGKQIRIVGVVGMGHMNGIIKHFGHTKRETVHELMKFPSKSWFKKRGNNSGSFTSLIMTILKNLKITK